MQSQQILNTKLPTVVNYVSRLQKAGTKAISSHGSMKYRC